MLDTVLFVIQVVRLHVQEFKKQYKLLLSAGVSFRIQIVTHIFSLGLEKLIAPYL